MFMPPEPMTLRWRVGLWLTACAAAGAAVLVPFPTLVFFIWAFPLGLVGVFVSSHGKSPGVTVLWLGPTLILLAGWLCYLYLSIGLLSRQRFPRFVLLYAIFIALLVLNVTGCHAVMGLRFTGEQFGL